MAEQLSPLQVGGPIPKALGRCADLYREIKDLRLAMEKEVEAVAAREKELKEHLIENLSKSDDTGAAGLKYRAQIVTKEKYNIANWGALTSWIRKNDRFDLLQKRLSDKAVKDLLDDNKQPPGVDIVLVPDVSVTKI